MFMIMHRRTFYRFVINLKNILPQFLIAANPDIPRIREWIRKNQNSLDDLNIIRIWVKENGKVIFDFPESIKNNDNALF
jgi:hypothetical protein